jgi:hypothetical protein
VGGDCEAETEELSADAELLVVTNIIRSGRKGGG